MMFFDESDSTSSRLFSSATLSLERKLENRDLEMSDRYVQARLKKRTTAGSEVPIRATVGSMCEGTQNVVP
jgi:hypothetical protein